MRGATAWRWRVPSSVCFNSRAPCGARLPTRPVRKRTPSFNSRAPCGARHRGREGQGVGTCFNSRAPCGARLPRCPQSHCQSQFQFTRPVRGATRRNRRGCHGLPVSIHAPRAGRDSAGVAAPGSHSLVSIHAPRAGRDIRRLAPMCGRSVSIHAPRAGRDESTGAFTLPAKSFNSRAPCGARLQPVCGVCRIDSFNSRAPCGARLPPGWGRQAQRCFNSRAPCGARQECFARPALPMIVSIHAPRAGRDVFQFLCRHQFACFNSRAPCGARLQAIEHLTPCTCFNSRAPCGARRPRAWFPSVSSCFNSRAPCGARRECGLRSLRLRSFNSRAPCGARRPRSPPPPTRSCSFNSRAPCGARRYLSSSSFSWVVSIHAPRAGRDMLEKVMDESLVVSIHAPRAGRDQ